MLFTCFLVLFTMFTLTASRVGREREGFFSLFTSFNGFLRCGGLCLNLPSPGPGLGPDMGMAWAHLQPGARELATLLRCSPTCAGIQAIQTRSPRLRR